MPEKIVDLCRLAEPNHPVRFFVTLVKADREEERILEGQHRAEAVEEHIDSLDQEEKDKVDTFTKGTLKQNESNSKKNMSAAQIRKRFKKSVQNVFF